MMKLSIQLLLLVLIPVIIFGMVFQISFSTIIQEQIISSHISEVNSLLLFATVELENPLYFKDLDKTSQIIDNLETHPNVYGAYVFHADGKVFSDGTNENIHYNQFLDDPFILTSLQQPNGDMIITNEKIKVIRPIVVGDTIGYLCFNYDLLPVTTTFLNLNTLLIIVALATAALSISIGQILKQNISTPISKIRKISKEISQGKFTKHEHVKGPKEIQELSLDILQMAEKLDSLQDELVKQEKLSSIGQIAARINHDLRNPLSVLSNSVDLMQIKSGADMDPALKKYLPIMKDAIERMNHQINQVLGHVKMKSIQLQHVDSQKLFLDSISQATLYDEIHVDVPSEKSLIYCDPNLMQVAITNILSNAGHAIGNNRGIISISVMENPNFITIEIEDSGPGISSENTEKIFEPLFTTKQEGTGLGLITCKNIVEQHKGKLSVRNSEHKGAVFSISIPKKIEN